MLQFSLFKKTKIRKMSTITVKPYIDKSMDDGIGLSSLGLNSFPNTSKKFQVPIKNGKFLTGFDPDASYLSTLDTKEKAKEIANIKAKCKEFDAMYPHLKICDCSLSNEFYSKMMIDLKSGSNYFNTENIIDQVKISIIRTGAKYSNDSYVAATFQEADTSNKDYFYFISDPELDIVTQVDNKKRRNKAVQLLTSIEDSISDLRLYSKFLLRPSKAINTLKSDALYAKLDDFIEGVVDGVTSKDYKDNFETFSKAFKLDKQEVFTKVVIKYAMFFNIIRQRSDKEYTYVKTGNELGKTPKELYTFLTNLKNQEIYEQIKHDVNTEMPIL
jgi:hypothetical protein